MVLTSEKISKKMKVTSSSEISNTTAAIYNLKQKGTSEKLNTYYV